MSATGVELGGPTEHEAERLGLNCVAPAATPRSIASRNQSRAPALVAQKPQIQM